MPRTTKAQAIADQIRSVEVWSVMVSESLDRALREFEDARQGAHCSHVRHFYQHSMMLARRAVSWSRRSVKRMTSAPLLSWRRCWQARWLSIN